jgi:nucleoside-diphosphate-sugar epimerase
MGCGWLGFPLAKFLVEKGYSVRGTTTDKNKVPHLEASGIEPYLISLEENEIKGPVKSFLNGMEAIVINIPPGLRGGENSNYVQKIKMLHEQIRPLGVRKVIFVSSTSVYGAVSGNVTEETPPMPASESGRQLLQVEDLFSKDENLKSTIVRFGGLIGPERHPVRFLSGRKGLKNGHHPVNLIHLEDCLSLLITILEKDWWGCIFNGVFPEHPLKQDYYRVEAEKKGLQPPGYSDESGPLPGKTVDSTALATRGFTFSKGIWSK